MSAANVKFYGLHELEVEVGQEQVFSFTCPNYGRRCSGLVIKGRTDLKHDPQGQNGGIAQWDWDGNREAPTFSPSIQCGKCWHGYIEKGRCLSNTKVDEPEPRRKD